MGRGCSINVPVQPATVLTALEALDHRLTAILMALRPLIAHHFARHPRIPGTVTVPLWNRIGRAARGLSRLIALFAFGRLPAPRRPPAAAAHAGRPAAARPARKPLAPIPTRRGWMLAALGWHVAGYRAQLETLLDRPEMADLLAAAPAAGRLLRPICHMLGITHPSLRRPPRPRPQPPLRHPARPGAEPGPSVEPAPAPHPQPQPSCPRRLARWPWPSATLPAAPRAPDTPLRRLSGPSLSLPLPA